MKTFAEADLLVTGDNGIGPVHAKRSLITL